MNDPLVDSESATDRPIVRVMNTTTPTRTLLILAAIAGFTGVLARTFGAH